MNSWVADQVAGTFDWAIPKLMRLCVHEKIDRTAEKPVRELDRPLNVSFSGACFMGVYGLGVATGLRELDAELGSCGGASIGALTAAGLLGGADLERGKKATWVILEEVREHPLRVLWNAKARLNTFIDEHMPPEVDVEALAGRLFISVTALPSGRNHIIHEFPHTQSVRETIVASCTIPVLMGIPPLVTKHTTSTASASPSSSPLWSMDGGFTNNLPSHHHSHPTVTVTPFRSLHPSASIARDDIPLSYAFRPPSESVCDDIFAAGWSDAEAFLKEHC